jgi:hypothetical protein
MHRANRDKDRLKGTVSTASEIPLKMYCLLHYFSYLLSDHIQFGMLSGTEMRDLSEIRIVNAHPYKNGSKVPVEYGPLDPRLVCCPSVFAELVGDKRKGREEVHHLREDVC